MKSLIEKTYDLILNSDESYINELVRQLPDTSISLLSMTEKRVLVYFYITLPDVNLFEQDNDTEDILESEYLQIDSKNIKLKSILACKFYEYYKFNKTESITDKLNKLGLRNMYHNHFVDLNDIDEILYELVQSGVYVNYGLLKCIIDDVYSYRIKKDIAKVFNWEVKNYGNRGELPKIQIDLQNIQRRNKYNSSNPNAKRDLFNASIQNMEQIGEQYGFSVIERLKDIITQSHKGLRNDFFANLKDYAQKFDRKTFLTKYKRFFHLLFEDDDIDGLLTEETFNKIYLDNPNNAYKYDGNYNKYYETRIKTLTGL